MTTTDARKRRHERDMADAHETARARDARDFLRSLGPDDARKWRVAQEVVARTVEFVRSAAFPGETTSAHDPQTAQDRDAAWTLGALDGSGGPRDRTHDDFHREWLYVMDDIHPRLDQETDMTDLPRTVITITGDRGPLHVAKGVLVNGSPVTVAEHGVDIDFGPDEVTTVTLRLLADEVHFVKPERVEVKAAIKAEREAQ